ncbi:MAG: beta-propeller fold lactonase family protein [Terriglobales bacterium]
MKSFLAILLLCITASAAESPMLAVSVRGENAVRLYDLQFTGYFGGNTWLRLTKSIPVGKQPGEMCLAPDGKSLFVSDVGSKEISVVDLSSQTAVGTLSAPGMKSPDGCAVSADSKKVYSVDQGAGAVLVFSVESKQLLKTVAVGKEPRRAILSPDGKRVLVSNAHSDSLSVIDTASDDVVKTVKTGEEPRDLAYSKDGKLLAVGLIAGDSVQFFDADTLEPKQQVAAVKSPEHMEFSPDSQRLYIVGKLSDDVGVMRIGQSPRMARTIDVPHSPLGAWDAWGMALSPDGKFMWVTNTSDQTISLIDVEYMQTVHAFPGGNGPVGVLYIKPAGGFSTMTPAAKLEHFRMLAKQAMDAVAKNDLPSATKLCQTLETEWDSGELDLRRSSPDVWNQVDEAMDNFIRPITTAGGVSPNPAALNTAYQNFLVKLKLVK